MTYEPQILDACVEAKQASTACFRVPFLRCNTTVSFCFWGLASSKEWKQTISSLCPHILLSVPFLLSHCLPAFYGQYHNLIADF